MFFHSPCSIPLFIPNFWQPWGGGGHLQKKAKDVSFVKKQFCLTGPRITSFGLIPFCYNGEVNALGT